MTDRPFLVVCAMLVDRWGVAASRDPEVMAMLWEQLYLDMTPDEWGALVADAERALDEAIDDGLARLLDAEGDA